MYLTASRCSPRIWKTCVGCSAREHTVHARGKKRSLPISNKHSNHEQLYYVSQILYVIVLCLVKISILLLFLRVFTNNRFHLVTKICLLWMVCQTVAFFFAVTLQCIPVSSVWDLSANRKCINTTAVIYAGAVCSIFEDIFIIILPIRELLALNMSSRQKLGVIFMFALGSLYVYRSLFSSHIFRPALTLSSACITSIVRLKFIVDYSFQLLDATCMYPHHF